MKEPEKQHKPRNVSFGRWMARCYQHKDQTVGDEDFYGSDFFYAGPPDKVPPGTLETILPLHDNSIRYYADNLMVLYKAGWKGGTESPVKAFVSKLPKWAKWVVLWFPFSEDTNRYDSLYEDAHSHSSSAA